MKTFNCCIDEKAYLQWLRASHVKRSFAATVQHDQLVGAQGWSSLSGTTASRHNFAAQNEITETGIR